MVITYKDWHEMLPYALHGYPVLPIEVKIPSLRVLAEVELEEVEWIQQRLDQLSMINEKRLNALCHGQLYQKRIKNAFDKKARPHIFKEGDMVLKKILPNIKDQRGKWAPNYEGSYVVKRPFSGGALILTDTERRDLQYPVNADYVKIFTEATMEAPMFSWDQRKAREIRH
ncbi:hypothetical protein CR513_06645, partial [Mucuna pruriens]